MTKKIFAIAMSALLLFSTMAFGAFATEAVAETTAAEVVELDEVLDYITAEEADAAVKAVEDNMNDSVVYIKFGSNKDNDGLTAETPKPNLGAADGTGTAGVLYTTNGGTLVATGKLYVGATYAFPEYTNTLKITSNDGTTDFKNPEPQYNPECALKIKQNSTLSFVSDAIIDDIILFNEFDGSSTTIAVTNNSTLVIGENVVSQAAETDKNGVPYLLPCHISLYVEDGSTLIVKGGTFEKISGGGNVYVADNVTVEEKIVPIELDENGMIKPSVEITLPIGIVDNEPEETTTEAVATTPAVVDETPAEGGAPVALIIGIVAAVVVVAVVVVIVAKKKK